MCKKFGNEGASALYLVPLALATNSGVLAFYFERHPVFQRHLPQSDTGFKI
jgi:hypothetical protein